MEERITSSKKYMETQERIVEKIVEEIDRKIAFQKKVLHSEYEGGYTHALEDVRAYLLDFSTKK